MNHLINQQLAEITDLYIYERNGKQVIACLFHNEAKALNARKLWEN